MKIMTKMALAAAVAASVSNGANAIPVTGTVTGMQMTVGSSDLFGDPNAEFTPLAIGGDTVTGLTLSGDSVLYTGGTFIGLSWNLTDGIRQGVNGAGGTIFYGGNIAITTSTDGGATYNPFDTIDASMTAIPFLAGVDGPIAPAPTQTTAGLVVDDAGYGTLPGFWDLTFYGAGWNAAAGALTLFGNTGGIFMEGSVAPVPVPAAAWLFGSALLGLGCVKRRRKAA